MYLTLCTVCCRRDNATWCVRDGNECAWCATTAQCFAFVEYVPRYPFGGCRHWRDGVAGGSDLAADDCSPWSDCRSCLHRFMCGWCSLAHNPTVGACFHGDFAGRYFSVKPSFAPLIIIYISLICSLLGLKAPGGHFWVVSALASWCLKAASGGLGLGLRSH